MLVTPSGFVGRSLDLYINFVDPAFSMDRWKGAVKKELNSYKATPESILKLMSQNPRLAECFAKDAGVSEKYTVGEHTKMVLEVALRYRDGLRGKVEEVVSWDKFLLFLVLHDIGKGQANENESAAFGTKISFKDAELKTTQKILSEVMGELDVPPAEVRFFSEMLAYDTQGLFLKGAIGRWEAFDNILEMARNCQMDADKLYQVFEAFHLVDAASYPGLRSLFIEKGGSIVHNPDNQTKVDELAKMLTGAVKGSSVFENLISAVESKKDVGTIRREFLNNLPELVLFLKSVHKEMLVATDNSTDVQQKFYRQVKRGFRDIFFYFAEHVQDAEKLQKSYQVLLHSSANREMPMPMSNGFTSKLFGDFSDKLSGAQLLSLMEFEDELMVFRQNYLCRFSLPKVQQYIEKALAKLNGEDSWLLSLLNITFLHGTRATILPNLLRTGMQLMSSGRLAQIGVVTFSGEQRDGASAIGVNHYQLSGTSLDSGSVALNYATREDYLPTQAAEVAHIDTFMEEYKITENSYFMASYNTAIATNWNRVISAVMRVRSIYPEAYSVRKDILTQMIDKLDADWKKFKTQPEYTRNMPKKLDPDGKLGYGHHDYYYYNRYLSVDEFVANLKKAITAEVEIPEGVEEAVKNPYALIMASKTLHTKNIELQNPMLRVANWERCAQKASALGKDIQTIFVGKENKENLTAFLEGQGLKDKVTLIDMEKLPKLLELNKAAGLYFADFASSKKLAKLTSNKSEV